MRKGVECSAPFLFLVNYPNGKYHQHHFHHLGCFS